VEHPPVSKEEEAKVHQFFCPPISFFYSAECSLTLFFQNCSPEIFGMPSLTKPFTLPGLRPANVMGKQEVKHTQSHRKVHLYVPPPLVPEKPNPHGGKSEGHHPDLPNASGTSSPTHPSYACSSFVSLDGAIETKSQTNEDVYPSPSRSHVLRPSIPQTLTRKNERTDIRLAREGRPTPIYRPPSPPTSGLPMPDEDTDIHTPINPEHVRKKHCATKALFEKVFADLFFSSQYIRTHLFRATFF